MLNKREAFRQDFDQFAIEKIVVYDEKKEEELKANPQIIRNRLKIHAAVVNAQIFREIQEEWESFDSYLWHWTDGQTIYEIGETRSELSDQISKDLKKRGMKFVGTTIIYSYLQAVGVIYSHEKGCFLEKQENHGEKS